MHKSETPLVKPLSLNECPGKTCSVDGHRAIGVSTYLHCIIVGEVSILLGKRFGHTPKMYGCKNWFEVGFMVSIHDVGKLSPGFINKILKDVGQHMEGLPMWVKGEDHYCDNHPMTSSYAISKFIEKITDRKCGDVIASISGSHHGSDQIPDRFNYPDIKYGGKEWDSLRNSMIKKVADRKSVV